MSLTRNEQNRNDWRFVRFALAVLLLASAVAVWSSVAPQLLAAEPGPLLPAADGVAPSSFANIIEAVEPGVVNVSVRGHKMAQMMPGMSFGPQAVPQDSPFEDFMRRFFGDMPGNGDPQGVPFEGAGTGFIIDPEGLVVTNYHVIDSADEIVVTLHDGSQHDATLRGHDPKTDLALLDIEGDGYPYVLFGDSDAARVGDWVIAIGNPFGLGGSASTGIISARGRNIQSGPYDDFLQIDAPINQGNSGGPLFDLSGKVVGINTAIYSPNGGNVGIGFAIPSALARPVIDELRATGRVERGWLGVSVQGLDAAMADGLGLDGPRGALVASVVAGGPAAKAGLRAGDVIVGFDGGQIADVRELVRRIAERDPGDSVSMEVVRQGDTIRMEVTLGVGPDEEMEIPTTAPRAASASESRLGLAVADVNELARRQFGIAADVSGALVTSVDPAGNAARKGLQPGDVIVMAGQKPIESAAELRQAVDAAADAGRSAIALQVARGETQWFVALSLDGR